MFHDYRYGEIAPREGQHVGGPSCACPRCELVPEGASDVRPDHRIRLDRATRGRVERGSQTAHLSDRRPGWLAGDVIAVYRSWAAETPDVPLVLHVSSVAEVRPGALALADARRLGHRTVADLHRSLVSADEHMHALALKARVDRLPAHWLTRWSVSIPHERRLLAPVIGEGGTPGYVSSYTSPQMSSAGEAVPADYQEVLCMDAQRKIRAAQQRTLDEYETRRRAAKARAQMQHRAESRRRRIDVTRTGNSRVVEPPREDTP